MIQFVLVIIGLFIIFIFLKGGKRKRRPHNEIESETELFKKEMLEFLKNVQKKPTKTRLKRLKIEIEKFNKAKQLDGILEKAEGERNSYKAIDYYLEAFSFITKNNFELEKKSEIKEKIRHLQGRIESSTSKI